MSRFVSSSAAPPAPVRRVRPEDYLPTDDVIAIRRWLAHPGIEDRDLSHRVARVCLNAVQGQLPQCGIVRPTGTRLTRGYDPRHCEPVDLAPQHLFRLNWADSAFGICWPEAYYATFVPGFGRWIVTMSVDCTDVWGVTDLAIGAFREGSDIVRSSGRIIVRYWRTYHCFDDEAEGWPYLFDTGLVDARLAYRWKKRVWRNAVYTP